MGKQQVEKKRMSDNAIERRTLLKGVFMARVRSIAIHRVRNVVSVVMGGDRILKE